MRLVWEKKTAAEVRGDRTRLEQALINLLDNAVKFNRPGGEVHLETSLADGKVRIVVADNGIGIPSEDRARIFERFYRVDKARSREMGGTGLGLSICRGLVQAMGGELLGLRLLELGALRLELLAVAFGGALRLAVRNEKVADESVLHLHHVAQLAQVGDLLHQDLAVET